MARPTKSYKAMNKHLTKEEKASRKSTEEKLRGNYDNIVPPKHLRKSQKDIFNSILDELEASKILGNVDVHILGVCAIAIDRMKDIEKMINKDKDLMWDKAVIKAKDQYTKEFFRCCNELSLSPQSRAKLGNINLEHEQSANDPLLKVMSGGKR